MGPKPSPRHEIDRIDNDKGYSPDNCRWVLRSENCRNRRSNVWLEFRGERKTLIEWCAILGLPEGTLRCRIWAGWSVEDAFTRPIRKKAPNGSARAA